MADEEYKLGYSGPEIDGAIEKIRGLTAAGVPIADEDGHFASGNVEGALAELAENGGGGTEYIAAQHGVLPGNAGEVNSQNLQALIDTVSEAGGGTIYIPAGVYVFHGIADNTIGKRCVKLKSNVAIRGDGTATVLKPTTTAQYPTPNGLDMFYFNDLLDTGTPNYLENCRFSDFVIDGAGQSCTTYTSAGKGFMINLMRNCHWSRVAVRNTDATGFGVDCPIDCTMDSCVAVNCGKAANTNSAGASGIGIGTGYTNEETMQISGCVYFAHVHFGIFFEHQRRFNAALYKATRGQGFLVDNCIGYGNYYNFGGQEATTAKFSSCNSSYALQHGFFLNNTLLCTLQNCESYVEANTGYVVLFDSATVGAAQSRYFNNVISGCVSHNNPYGVKLVSTDTSKTAQKLVLIGCSLLGSVTNSILTSGTFESMYLKSILADTGSLALNATVGTLINEM